MAANALRGRRFWALLSGIVLAGALLRVGYVVAVTRDDDRYYDALYYKTEARNLTQGKWFNQPLLENLDPPIVQPSAEHPPLTSLVLAPAALISDSGARDLAMRLTMVAVGCGTVLLVGLIGRSLAGPGAGLVAAAIAAVDPNLWMNDGILMSESLATLGAAALIYLAYRVWRGHATWRWSAGVGAVAALTTLARSELVFLLPLLVIPALIVGSSRGPGHATPSARLPKPGLWWRPVGLSVLAFGLVIAPWALFNLSRFEEPSPMSSAFGVTVLAANCHDAYYGPDLGLTGLLYPSCVPPSDNTEEPSVRDGRLRQAGLSYMYHHADRLPVVVAARLGRVFYVYRVDHTMDYAFGEGRPMWAQWLGAGTTWILVPLAAAGWWALRRRAAAIWPLLAPLVAVVGSFVIAAGVPRYRAGAEPTLVVLAAVAAVHLVGRRRIAPSAADQPVGEPGFASPIDSPEQEPAPT